MRGGTECTRTGFLPRDAVGANLSAQIATACSFMEMMRFDAVCRLLKQRCSTAYVLPLWNLNARLLPHVTLRTIKALKHSPLSRRFFQKRLSPLIWGITTASHRKQNPFSVPVDRAYPVCNDGNVKVLSIESQALAINESFFHSSS